MTKNHSVDNLPIPNNSNTVYHWGQLYGSGYALILSKLKEQFSGLVVVLAGSVSEALNLKNQTQFFLEQSEELVDLPGWETLPYDQISPHHNLVSQRLRTLQALPKLKQGLLFCTLNSTLQRYTPKEYIDNNSFIFHKRQNLDFSKLIHKFESSGYTRVSQIMEHGEFSVRGEIIDLYPMGYPRGLRLNFFDNEIETIKEFDPETQLSTKELQSIKILPGREVPIDKTSISKFTQNWFKHFEDTDSVIYQSVIQGLSPAGIEYFLPLFFDRTDSLFDYFPKETLIVSTADISDNLKNSIREYQTRYHETDEAVLKPSEIILRGHEFFDQLNKFKQIKLNRFELEDKPGYFNFSTLKPSSLKINNSLDEPMQALTNFVNTYQGRILFLTESAGRREVLRDMLSARKIYPANFDNFNDFVRDHAKTGISIGSPGSGLSLQNPNICLITESQIFGQHFKQHYKRPTQDKDEIINSLIELKVDDPVVHVDNGVGLYRGLKTLDASGQTAEYLILEYAKGDILYVPVDSLNLIHRYTGADAEHAPIHRLGSGQWQKVTKKARQKVHDAAAELLEIYARRKTAKNLGISEPDEQYQIFAAEFPYITTPDQQKAIDDTVIDMQKPMPMDRLICGDVGFGKTEVAMRAAFLTGQNDRQTAVLVPTTLLAQQHYKSFTDRFAKWPINIEVLSRFGNNRQTQTSLKKIESGNADIIIGTHRLLSADVKFANLGLLIIDEEHRFGVKQKEKFKSLRAEIDILTLAATPIPRTLNLSVSGIRDLSIIVTPPDNRLAIKTFIQKWDTAKIRESCFREISRGGQVYFLHNRVENIEKIARELAKLVPEAVIGVAHGQIHRSKLEQIMQDFYRHKINILVCTTIIETGIDVPTANTIIINRADKLGLAQLYQIRGRVGRSHHNSYAYLIVPDEHNISDDARKRLEAIESLEKLGAGFTLAIQDMEIRGTGEILGEEQSGQINEVGLIMYTEILEQAVDDLKNTSSKQGIKSVEKEGNIEIQIGEPAILPEDYMPDVNDRLVIYKRIASAENDEILTDIKAELIDRFGSLPEPAKTLFANTKLKLELKPTGIKKILADTETINLEFNQSPDIDPKKLTDLIQNRPELYKLLNNSKLTIKGIFENAQTRIKAVNNCIQEITP